MQRVNTINYVTYLLQAQWQIQPFGAQFIDGVPHRLQSIARGVYFGPERGLMFLIFCPSHHQEQEEVGVAVTISNPCPDPPPPPLSAHWGKCGQIQFDQIYG